MGAFLGIERSVTGRRWTGPDAGVERAGLAIAQAAGVPEVVGRVLAARGVAAAEAEAYLDPKLRDLMPDPSSLRDMDAAAERLVRAVERGERIALFGDYDVDGAASTALVFGWLQELGCSATVYIPDRMTEGYGPNAPAMAKLATAHDLIVCLDCGTAALEPLEAAAGTDVVVVDHHLGGETLPRALAIVNPNRQDEDGALGHLCAAGVAFLWLAAANRMLREKGR
ncbi:MAG: DHH family phosphoesterase, partial [Pseudomonadota bacterium]